MTASDAARIFERIALLMEMNGENPFKVRAYRSGVEVIETFPGDIMARAAAEDLGGIKGLGEALRDKLQEMATTGRLAFYEKLLDGVPESFFELFEVQGLGPKKVKALRDAFGVVSIADLRRVCESGEAEKLAGFGGKTVEKLLQGIAFRETHAHEFRQEQIAPVVDQVLALLRQHPDVSQSSVAGSYRRAKETMHDVDFLVATKNPASVMDCFVHMPGVKQVLGQGETKSSVLLDSGVQCDLRAVKNEEFACALVYFTGSKEHNIVLRSRALERGWSLNEYGFTRVVDSLPALEIEPGQAIHDTMTTESDVYRFLGLDYIEPELRENSREFVAAATGKLPKLVELTNLRGCFHNHTTSSDGTATLREMADAAQELGWQYLGIADHSKSSVIAGGLDEKRLRAQIEEIRELNDELSSKGFRIFAGSEVDILKDGSLDFDDALLGELDFVVASVHNVFTLSEAEQTQRIVRAIQNPHVTMLGHVTGRLLLERPSYAVNIPAIIEAAAATGTIIEINSNPWRLELDWRWWMLAKEKGVKCSINPDAHSTRGLQDVFYGTRIARKGWLTKEDVVNCLPLGMIEKQLLSKRAKLGQD